MKFLFTFLAALVCMQQLFAQNIGIGTTSPSGKLEVEHLSGPENPQLKLIEKNNDNFVRLVMKNKSFPTYWTIGSNNTTPANKDVLAFYHSNKGEIFQIDGNGNMGLGMPASLSGINAKLSVDGGTTQSALYVASANNSIFLPVIQAQDKTTGGTGGVSIYTQSNTGIALLASSGGRGIITTGGGKSGFGILNPLEMVEVNGAIKIGNTSSTNGGTIRYTGTDFQGYVGGEWRSFVGGAASTQWVLNGNNITNSNAGNVGIGAEPAAGNKLDVTNTNANGIAINATGATGLAATSAAGLAGSFSTATGTAIFANVTNASGKGLIVLGGKVGFGVLNPTEQVDVNGAIRVGSTSSTNPGTIRYNGSDLQGYVDGQWKSLTNAAGGQWVANGNNISNSNTGNVGVGTTTPNYKLHLTGGDLFIQSNTGLFRLGYSGGNEWQMATTNAGADLRWYTTTNGGTTVTARHYFSQNGNVGLGDFVAAKTPEALLHVFKNADVWHSFIGGETGRLQIGGQTPTGAVIQSWNPTTNVARDLYLQRDGGNVGIGTTTPTAKLEVAGQIKITGGTPGAGKVLTSDANGLASWQTASGDGPWATTGANISNSNTGNVGIGTITPNAKLEVASSASSYPAIVGSSIIQGNTFGYGSGTGVYGETGTGVGVYGYSGVNAGVGVVGSATGSDGIGGYFDNSNGNGLALKTATGGVQFNTLSGTGNRMVVADATGKLSTQAIPSGGGGGLTLPYNQTSTEAYPFIVRSSEASWNSAGIAGYSTIPGSTLPLGDGTGVYGASGSGNGVGGVSSSGAGVSGFGRTGVYGGANGENNNGGYFENYTPTGLALKTASGGVQFNTLSGTGNRMVIADATGKLSTQAIPSGGGGSTPWTTTGNNISNNNSGNVGIGTGVNVPAARLDVNGNGIFSAISSLAQPQLVLAEQQSGNFSRLNFKNTNQSSYWTIAGLNTNSSTNDRLNFYHSTAGDVLSISGDKKATLNGSLNIATTGGTALSIDNGFIKVSGTNRSAFTVTGTSGNTSGHILSLNYANAAASDIVIATHNFNPIGAGSSYHNAAIGVYWTGSTWAIFSEDTVTQMLGKSFNVMVIKQ